MTPFKIQIKTEFMYIPLWKERVGIMNRETAYRILGIRQGASAEDIMKAYEKKLHKLSSEDYKDDIDYLWKKKKEAKEAFEVLTGQVLEEKWGSYKNQPFKANKGNKKENSTGKTKSSFESMNSEINRLKLEDLDVRDIKSKVKEAVNAGTGKKYKNTNTNNNKNNQLLSIIIGLVMFVVFMTININSCTQYDMPNDYEEDEYVMDREEYEEFKEEVNNIEMILDSIDYKENLGERKGKKNSKFTVSDFTVDYYCITMSDAMQLNSDKLKQYLEENDPSYDRVDYLKKVNFGEYDEDHSYSLNLMLNMVKAPLPEDVIGRVNIEYGNVIKDFDEYILFISNTIKKQIALEY